ncbi:hypothetical protein H0H93_013211 [Arthromyces matolae]|nr:hypothetical protein H0H93_013211 [Arthromyces matolae]
MLRPPGIPRISSENAPVVTRNGDLLPPYNTVYYFDQLIDHNNKSLGTFKQRYWHTYEFYEPGGPIILTTRGEGNADGKYARPILCLATKKPRTGYEGFLTKGSITGLIAQQQNGSTILLEHRFYGFSNPYPDLSVKSLRVHNLQQAVDDLVYFARNVHLPMPGGDQVTPDKAPWILVGGSYSGALMSWTMVSRPGVFWAGYASSAVVEAIFDFWRYFEPIRTHMPANCSADVEAVKNGTSAPPGGWGLEHALPAWGSYFKNTYLPNQSAWAHMTPTQVSSRTLTSTMKIAPGIGSWDPWLEATVSATQHTVQSTPQQPIYISDGFHCSDLTTKAGLADPTIRAVQDAALGYFRDWLAQWKPNPQPLSPANSEISPLTTSSKDVVYTNTQIPIGVLAKVVRLIWK